MSKFIKNKEENNLVCTHCTISYNVASRYRVLKCEKSPKFNKTHTFRDFKVYVEIRRRTN